LRRAVACGSCARTALAGGAQLPGGQPARPRRDPVLDRGGVSVTEQGELVGDHGGPRAIDDPGGQQGLGLRQPFQAARQLQQACGGAAGEGQRGGELLGHVLAFAAVGASAAGVQLGHHGQL
jgi:hypothetical protein